MFSDLFHVLEALFCSLACKTEGGSISELSTGTTSISSSLKTNKEEEESSDEDDVQDITDIESLDYHYEVKKIEGFNINKGRGNTATPRMSMGINTYPRRHNGGRE